MAALLHASAAKLSVQCLGTNRVKKTPVPQFRSVCGFEGTRLALTAKPRLALIAKPRQQPGIVRAAKPDTIIEDICQVGDHFLDTASNFILRQIQKPLAKYIPDDWDPLDFLPINIQSHLQKSEAVATLVLRECIVLAFFYFLYNGVDRFCRSMYKLYMRKRKHEMESDDHHYNSSPFRAARAPLRSSVMVWAGTRLLGMIAVLGKMQEIITYEFVYDIRATSLVCLCTWFLFRWKRIFVAEMVERKVMEESQIFTIDKFASLAMYCIAASCIAEVLGFTLKSFLAVGGVSGLAVGVAAQVVVGNMFGGAALFLTRPFVVGEKIKAGNVLGRVQDIGFMQTKVTGFDGVPVYVPNNAFTSQVITNFSRAQTMVLEASMQLNNRHIFLVHVITDKVQDYLRSHSHVEKIKSAPICYLKGMENDGPVIALSCVIKAQRGPRFFTIQQEILIQVAQIITDILGPDSPFTPLKAPSSDVNFMKNQQQKLVL